MADSSMFDFLSGVQMTEVAQSEAIKGGLPNPLPPALFDVSPEKPVGMNVQYVQFNGTRENAKVVHHLSPSRRAEQPGAIWKQVTGIGTKENFVIDAERLMGLKSNLSVVAERARRQIVRDLMNFRRRADNLRTTLVASAFANGGIYYDDQGNVLPSSSGAYTTFSYGIPASNVLTKTSTIGSSSVVVGDWSSATTDIENTLRTLRQQNAFNNNYNLKNILYGKSIPSYFANNTVMQTFMSRQNPDTNRAFIYTNEVPQNLLDFTWWKAGEMYFVDAGGTVRQLFADNTITVFPEIEDNWYEFVECGTLVPRSMVTVGQTLDQMINQCDIVNGRSSYCTFSADPLACQVVAQDYYVPIIKVPGVVWQITVS